jgi:hypothetical protein
MVVKTKKELLHRQKNMPAGEIQNFIEREFLLRKIQALPKEKSPSVETERPLTIACHMKIFNFGQRASFDLTN